MLIDVLNTDFHDQAYARQQIRKFLRALESQGSASRSMF